LYVVGGQQSIERSEQKASNAMKVGKETVVSANFQQIQAT
jgi:hypothetical protein